MNMDENNKPDRNVHLGFPNAALDSVDVPLDLNKLVVKNRSSTFYMRVDGDSWEELGIYSGDILTIDRALQMRSGDVFVGMIDGEFVLRRHKGSEDEEIDFWGIITYAVHEMRQHK